MPHDKLHEAAIGFLFSHQGEHLHPDRNLLMSRCAQHLRTLDTISEATANVIACQAMGDIAARGNGVHIDLATTTSYAVFVVDPVGKGAFFFTATDLVRIGRQMGEAIAATATSTTKH